MAALGILLMTIGGLSYLLPTIGLQLKLVKLMQLAHPEAGKYCLMIGGGLFVLGLLFGGKGGANADLGEVVADKGEEEKAQGGGGSAGLVTLFIVALLAGAVYVLHTKYNTFDPLLKAAHEEIQKHMPKPKDSPAPSALTQLKK